MIMPCGTKESQATSDKAPPKIDFDELWLNSKIGISVRAEACFCRELRMPLTRRCRAL
jgi:hypothetical protein